MTVLCQKCQQIAWRVKDLKGSWYVVCTNPRCYTIVLLENENGESALRDV